MISYGCLLKCLVKFAGLAGFQVCLWLPCGWWLGFSLGVIHGNMDGLRVF